MRTFTQATQALGRTGGKVILMRPASVTHSFNFDQRLVELRGSIPENALTFMVQAPSNSNIAPPGYYLLFVIKPDAQGPMPSQKGEFVKLGL